jgi:hypothetical protein
MLPTEEKKKRAFIFLAIAVVVLFILAIGVSGLTFKEATLLDLSPALPATGTPQTAPVSDSLLKVVRIFLAVVLIAFPFFLIYMLINPKRRKELFRNLIFYAILLFAFYQISAMPKNIGKTIENNGLGAPPASSAQPMPTPPDANNIAPPWLINTVGIAVGALGLAAIGFGVYWFFFRIRGEEIRSIRRVAYEAQEAIDAIQAGGNLKDAIIQCYRQMIAAVRLERGIQRPYDATPREFEQLLLEKGLPPGPVRNLTSLFEQARYGEFQGGYRHQLEAVSCLEEIIVACRKTAEPQPAGKGKTA